jgi:hypothetical protein
MHANTGEAVETCRWMARTLVAASLAAQQTSEEAACDPPAGAA